MREPKLGPTQFKLEVEKLQREGRMPTLDQLLEAIRGDARRISGEDSRCTSGSKIMELTLNQIADVVLIPAAKQLTPEQRRTMTFEAAMKLVRTPVGGLKRKI